MASADRPAAHPGAGRQPATFPLALRMQGRLAVVVGGGAAAAYHVAGLLAAGARVLVVAAELTDELAALAARGVIATRRGDYEAGDLDGAWLLLACADDDAVNVRAAGDAGRMRIWCAAGGDAAAAALLPAPGHPAAGAEGGGSGQSGSGSHHPGGGSPAGTRPARRVLVLGGARSGKSAAAESMLASAPAVDYVATGQPAGAGDAEWDERVRGHRARRPAGWRTLETCDVAGVLADREAAAPVLVDCLATWLTRIMDDCGAWSGDDDAGARLEEHTDALVAAWRRTSRDVVAVSNEVGSGIVPASASGRRFRDELGWLNSRIAAESDEVWLSTAGIPRRLR